MWSRTRLRRDRAADQKLAKEEGIPMIENVRRARAIAERVRVIPTDLYIVVAELLATVYRLKNRTLRGIRA
ncbi:MAG TPA: EscU/YscU/HrcU family type III secretion system export apparatus switch protein [Polyangiaceae bacterium]|nr:EscU/YscU/HrcU family type III secretion system export apparatus switch protein [Polyangiaceae bacterium]